MAHKDLSELGRRYAEGKAQIMAEALYKGGHSLSLAREAWINAFDKAASELEATDAKDQA